MAGWHPLPAVLLYLLTAASAAQSQWPPGIEPGARVRVTVPEEQRQPDKVTRGHELRGRVMHLNLDTLYLAVTDSLGPLAVPRSATRRIDLSRGVPSAGASALRRGLVTGVLGAVAGVLLVAGDNEPGGSSEGDAALIGGGIGLVMGGVLGAVFPTERWRRIRLEPLSTAWRVDGVRLAFSGGF